jgi:putative SOS response-associated peptidase YedK
MCGRFQASRSVDEITRWFKTTGPAPNVRQRYNAGPTQDLPVVLLEPDTGERRLLALRWGLAPFWAKDSKSPYAMINAMAEAVATARAFRDAFKSRRCLVPADAFYEWTNSHTNNKPKQPYRFVMKDGSPMAFGGLWEPARGNVVSRFVIITGAPNALCAPIHNRMPIILDPIDHPAWLGETLATPAELQALLRSFPAERMEAHPVAPQIGNVKNDDATLIERLNLA